MSHAIKLMAAYSLVMMFIVTAMTVQAATAIQSLPDKGIVTISGTIDKVSNEREFIVRDNSGSVGVKLAAGQAAVLKKGDNVTVLGTVEKPMLGLMGKSILASNVEIINPPTAASTAAPITVDQAKTVQIGRMPPQGKVQVTGTAENVGDPKRFTLKDATGKIDVEVETAEKLTIPEGAEVSVTAFVNDGASGRKLSATDVNLVSTKPADTGNMNAVNTSR